jgi:uncharacterized SAM-binding protein YcdF (DUF218 family)
MTAASATEFFFAPRADVAAGTLFVFGSPHHHREFAARIHELWTTEALRHIVVSGHGGEAEGIAALARRLGVPAELFRLETAARNTLENVTFSAAVLRDLCPDRRIHLLCKLHAAPRSQLTFNTVLPGWRVSVHTVDYFGVDAGNWRRNAPFVAKLKGELERIIRYGEKGDLAAPEGYAALATALLAELNLPDHQR